MNMPFSIKDAYHLPYITNVPNNTPRIELPTAQVEFCDLTKPSENDVHGFGDRYNAFRAKQPLLPRIHKKVPDSAPEQDVLTKSYPTFSFTKHKVQTRFTEGLSSMSKLDEPTYTFQRKDVLAANLPDTIKLSQEVTKSYFSVRFKKASDEKTKKTPKLKRLAERGRIATERKDDENSLRIPALQFAPEVYEDSPTHISAKRERPPTPYYQDHDKPRRHIVVPHIVCVGALLPHDTKEPLSTRSQNIPLHPNLQLHVQNSQNLNEPKLSSAQIEISDGALRDASVIKPNIRSQSQTTSKLGGEQNAPTSEYKDEDVGKDEEASGVLKFVVKMPLIHDTNLSVTPQSTFVEGFRDPNGNDGQGLRLDHCNKYEDVNINSDIRCSSDLSHKSVPDVEVLKVDLHCREVTTQIYSSMS